jgi:acyl-CoA synthetase (AMP-forming)/AMP-acid ligase II
VVDAPHAARGYEGDEEETRAVFRADGIHTGDLGWTDSEGFLFLVGRSKDLIKSGSENILPREIEEFLLQHPAVAECAVIGAPDTWLGEVVQAFVVPAPGGSLDAHEVLRFCRRGLSPIKRPQRVIICQDLPRTPNGKVDKRALQQTQAGPERGNR